MKLNDLKTSSAWRYLIGMVWAASLEPFEGSYMKKRTSLNLHK